mmetsp:Transcript_36623/g.117592  ORF Transcript_36623/g.117592 Transcript_36623/m.117592 type:complete len:202 (-) Transcript_36623:3683-4288(-)
MTGDWPQLPHLSHTHPPPSHPWRPPIEPTPISLLVACRARRAQCSVNWAGSTRHAAWTRAGVSGASSCSGGCGFAASARAAWMAERTARKAAIARAIGGSAHALDLRVAFGAGLGARGRKETLNSRGMSCTAGTLYSHVPSLVSRPEGERSVSSEKKRPSAMTKPPSTWPRSISGFNGVPWSISRSARRMATSPVRQSTST